MTPIEKETEEILNDKELMNEIKESVKDVENGKTIPWEKTKIIDLGIPENESLDDANKDMDQFVNLLLDEDVY